MSLLQDLQILQNWANLSNLLLYIGNGAWIYQFLASFWYRSGRIAIRDISIQLPASGWPGVTLIFAARNEAEKIEACLQSLLALDYPQLRLLAVNDRSTDQTEAILRQVSQRDPRLEVLTINKLPNDWLGKNHALQHAAQHAQTPWLLFTDADVVFDPLVLKRAISYCEQHDIDHLSMFPATVAKNPWEKIFLNYFSLLMAFRHPTWRIENPRSPAHIGIGAFNLLRRPCFEAIDGFTHLKLSVDDDIRLGEALKRSGYKLKLIVGGRGGISVRWQDSFWGHIIGLEKNIYAGLNFNLLLVFGSITGLCLLGFAPFVGLLSRAPWLPLLSIGALLSIFGLVGFAQPQNQISRLYAGTAPLGAIFMTLAILNSTVKTIRRGGIVWRQHFYATRVLKVHVKERSLWLKGQEIRRIKTK